MSHLNIRDSGRIPGGPELRSFWERRKFWAFVTLYKLRRIRSRLNGLDRLPPGDFRTVRQELYYLGDDVSDEDRLDALEAELGGQD